MSTATATAKTTPITKLATLTASSATFTKLFDWLKLLGYTRTQREVVAEIIRIAGRKGITHAQVATIAYRAGCSKTSVRNTTRRLRADGLLFVRYWYVFDSKTNHIKTLATYTLHPEVVRVSWLPVETSPEPLENPSRMHACAHARMASNFDALRDGPMSTCYGDPSSCAEITFDDDQLVGNKDVARGEKEKIAHQVVETLIQLVERGQWKTIKNASGYAHKLALKYTVEELQSKLEEYRNELNRPIPVTSNLKHERDEEARRQLRVGEYIRPEDLPIPETPDIIQLAPDTQEVDFCVPTPETDTEAVANQVAQEFVDQIATTEPNLYHRDDWKRETKRQEMDARDRFYRRVGAPVNVSAREAWVALWCKALMCRLVQHKQEHRPTNNVVSLATRLPVQTEPIEQDPPPE